MTRIPIAALVLSWLMLSSSAQAVTINLTLGSDLVSSPGQVIYTVGVEDALSGSGVSINGYTLDIDFDTSELTFVGAEQLVTFGTLGIRPFGAPNDCSNLRCTSGNILNEDSPQVGSLFSVTFDIIGRTDDQLDDFSAGILDSVFDDVTQATGQPVFDKGTIRVSAMVVPEPSTSLLLGLGLAGFAVRSNWRRCSS